YHVRAAEQGAWVEFDGIREASLQRHVELVRFMTDRRLLGRTLISQDAGWYHVGEPGGGQFRSYETIFTRFVPELRRQGGTDADVRALLVENPARALTRP